MRIILCSWLAFITPAVKRERKQRRLISINHTGFLSVFPLSSRSFSWSCCACKTQRIATIRSQQSLRWLLLPLFPKAGIRFPAPGSVVQAYGTPLKPISGISAGPECLPFSHKQTTQLSSRFTPLRVLCLCRSNGIVTSIVSILRRNGSISTATVSIPSISGYAPKDGCMIPGLATIVYIVFHH